jgi:hypothetical protein
MSSYAVLQVGSALGIAYSAVIWQNTVTPVSAKLSKMQKTKFNEKN